MNNEKFIQNLNELVSFEYLAPIFRPQTTMAGIYGL